MEKIRKAAVIGYGYWGKNIARVFSQSSHFELHTVCDSRPEAQKAAKKSYPYIATVGDFKEISKDVEVVAIISPADTHFELAKHFLENGKHVLVTKPLVKTLAQAEQLFEVAAKHDRTLFVDHTFVFHPAVHKLKEMMPRIGTPHFVLAQRLNLGLYQPDVNVIFDLMPHDLSIMCYLFDRPVKHAETVSVRAAGLVQEDLAHSNVTMDGGVHGLFTVSWLSPFKVRQFLIVGSAGILSYDDTDVLGKVKFFDRGISIKDISGPMASTSAYTSLISYRSGDLFSPAVSNEEALNFELKEFNDAILYPKKRAEFNQLNLNIMISLERVVNSQKKWE